MAAPTTAPRRTRLRRPTLVAAPLWLVAVAATSVVVAVGLWGVWNEDDLGATFWSVEVAALLVAVLAVVSARGCFVEVDHEGDTVRDVVAWRTRCTLRRTKVVAARVRAGPWRWFELETSDGDLVTLAGIAPVQFPARLMPGARERDLADLDLLLGDEGGTLGDG